MNRKDPCERYCSSCAWPVECAADEACRRREAGEVRSVYPGSDSAAITAVGKRVIIGMDLASGPDMTSAFHAGPVVITPLKDPGNEAEALRERVNRFIHNSVTRGR